jgi:DNA polymerase-3 subunit beta
LKFRSERDVLMEALSTAGRAVPSRGAPIPALSGVRLAVTGDSLAVTGSDMDLTISVETTVAGLGDGLAVAPGRLLSDIVRAVEPGAVTVEAVEEELHIAAGRSHFTVRTHPTDDFPRLAVPTGDTVSLATTGLAEALRQVTRAASNVEERPILTGVLMEAEAGGLRLVATDSYRLAVRDLPGVGVLAEGQKVLIPSRALNELQRLLGSHSGSDVSLRLGAHDATFTVGPVTLTTRLIAGEFPTYRNLLPSGYPNRLTVAREAFMDAIRRVKLLATDTPIVRLSLGATGVELSVGSREMGSAVEEVDAKYEGQPMTIAFNPNFLMDGVEAVTGDEVALDTLDDRKPATLRPLDSAEYLYLLMPVRVP